MIAGRYQLRESLGGGGVGQVFKAWDVQSQRAVAVKVFNPNRCDDDALARYSKLVAAAGRTGNPGLVLPKGFGLANKNPPMIVMDALTGDDASKLRARLGRVPWMRALELAGQCAEILHATFAATRTAHRDLKPSNLFITDRGEVRVLDYGVAEFDAQSADSTRVDTALGTVDYRAPEQLEGAPSDDRTDVFALGVVLFELVSGQLPFRGNSYYEVARKILMEPVPSLAQVAPEAAVPAGVEGLIRRALAKKPDERFSDLKSMAEAIGMVRRSPGAAPGAVKTASGTMIDPNAVAKGAGEDDPTALLATNRAPRAMQPARGSLSGAPDRAVPADRTVVVGDIGGPPGGLAGLGPRTIVEPVAGGPRTMIDPGAGGPRTIIDPGAASRAASATGPRTVIGPTTGAGGLPPEDRTVVHRTVVEPASGDRTVVLPGPTAGPSRADTTMILPDPSLAPSRADTTMILPDPSLAPGRGESTMILPDPSATAPRGESTMALPDVTEMPTMRRGESTMALPDAGQVGPLDRRRPAVRPAEWSLQKTLIVVNVACGLLILVGLLIMMLVG